MVHSHQRLISIQCDISVKEDLKTMGTVSVTKLGGISLALGPVIALFFFLIQPGSLLIQPADPASAQASIAALMSNSSLTQVSALFIPIGLIMFLYGANTLQSSITGNGSALSGWGTLFLMFAVITVLISSSMQALIAGGSTGTAVGAVYAIGLGISTTGSIILGLGFLFLFLGISTNDSFNKKLAYVAVVTAIVHTVVSVIGATDSAQLQTMQQISGLCYVIVTVYAIILGRSMISR